MKNIEEFIKLKVKENYFSCEVSLQEIEIIKNLMRETAKATVEKTRPNDKLFLDDVNRFKSIGYRVCFDEFNRKAKEWVGEK